MHRRSGKSTGNTKTITLTISVWYDEKSEHIHLVAPETDWFHSTINDREGSARRHANLFRKLGELLREAGVAAPEQSNEAMQTPEDDS